MGPSSAYQPSLSFLYVRILPPIRLLASIIVTYKSREKKTELKAMLIEIK